MVRLYIPLNRVLLMPLAAAPLFFGLGLAACTATRPIVAGRDPGVCGGDFGMLEQMQHEVNGIPEVYRGNPKPVCDEAYSAC
jgi:hypothetical protein